MKLYNGQDYQYDIDTGSFEMSDRKFKKFGGSSFYQALPELHGSFDSYWKLYIHRTRGMRIPLINAIHVAAGNILEGTIADFYIDQLKTQGYKILEKILFEPADHDFDYFGNESTLSENDPKLVEYKSWFQGIPDAWVRVINPKGEEESIMLEVKTAKLAKRAEWDNPSDYTVTKYGTAAEYVKQLQAYLHFAKELKTPIYKEGMVNRGVIVAMFLDKGQPLVTPTANNVVSYEIEREDKQIIKDLNTAKTFKEEVINIPTAPKYDGPPKTDKFYLWFRFHNDYLFAHNAEERLVAEAGFLADWFYTYGKSGSSLDWRGSPFADIITELEKHDPKTIIHSNISYAKLIQTMELLGDPTGLIVTDCNTLATYVRKPIEEIKETRAAELAKSKLEVLNDAF